MNSIRIAMDGYSAWAAKAHNAKWVRLIDGTPIPNDLPVCIAMVFAEALRQAERDALERAAQVAHRLIIGDEPGEIRSHVETAIRSLKHES